MQPRHGPMTACPTTSGSAPRIASSGTPNPPATPPPRRRRTSSRRPAPPRFTTGPPLSPCRSTPAQRHDGAGVDVAAVGVRRERGHGRAGPAGDGRQRAVLGVADQHDGAAGGERAATAAAGGVRSPGTRRSGDVVRRRRPRPASLAASARRAPRPRRHRSPATTWAFVATIAGAQITQPDPWMFRPQALALDPHHAALVAAGGRAVQDARVGRRQRPVGDGRDHRQRVEPGERVQHLVGRHRPQERREASSSAGRRGAARAPAARARRRPRARPARARGWRRRPVRRPCRPSAAGRARAVPRHALGDRCRSAPGRQLPPTSAPTMLASGSHGRLGRPGCSRCGAIRAPTSAPIAKPARPSTFATRPRRAPEQRRHRHPRDQTIRSHQGYTAARAVLCQTAGMDFVELEDDAQAAQPRAWWRPSAAGTTPAAPPAWRRAICARHRRRAVRGDRLRAVRRLPADAARRCTWWTAT